MFYVIRTDLPKFYSDEELKLKATRCIISNLKQYRITTADLVWEDYCKKHFHKDLKSVCRYLIKHLSINKNYFKEVIITFDSVKSDQIASLLAHGDYNISSAKIMNYIFKFSL